MTSILDEGATMARTLVSLFSAAALALAVFAGPAAAAPKTVKGTVGPGFTIAMTMDGKKVTTLKAGVAYRFRITDRSAAHDFHLKGPGVNRVVTGVAYTGTKSITLTLRKGNYSYVCDPHSSSMKGTFKVT
jgi:plastocyanin